MPDRAAAGGGHLAFLANHLTIRDRWLARVVGEHRVFTTTQLTHLAFGSARTANQRLLQLYQWRVLDRFQPLLAVGSAPMHYVLDLSGAASSPLKTAWTGRCSGTGTTGLWVSGAAVLRCRAVQRRPTRRRE